MATSKTEPRSVWTLRDEMALNELTERKQRIVGQNREELERVLTEVIGMRAVDVHGFISDMITAAEVLRDALAPFDSRSLAEVAR